MRQSTLELIVSILPDWPGIPISQWPCQWFSFVTSKHSSREHDKTCAWLTRKILQNRTHQERVQTMRNPLVWSDRSTLNCRAACLKSNDFGPSRWRRKDLQNPHLASHVHLNQADCRHSSALGRFSWSRVNTELIRSRQCLLNPVTLLKSDFPQTTSIV
jgi:hypothetical protein